MSAFGAPFGSMSVADLGSLTRLEIESNRKREGELVKLRKLLEESQLESEDAMNVLRKKHQDACLDYQDQVEQLQKKNAKSRFLIVSFTLFADKTVTTFLIQDRSRTPTSAARSYRVNCYDRPSTEGQG
uniref:Protein CASP n=1 Tax=Heterorhabditis bacteriophora TaxID=37862 RepID=A0A1I7WYK9_HETBA